MKRNYVKISTSWAENCPEGEGAAYLIGKEIDTRYGLGRAIATLYSALTCPVDEIDERIARAQRTAQNYWEMARSRPGYQSHEKPQLPVVLDQTQKPQADPIDSEPPVQKPQPDPIDPEPPAQATQTDSEDYLKEEDF